MSRPLGRCEGLGKVWIGSGSLSKGVLCSCILSPGCAMTDMRYEGRGVRI